ncbi:MAG: 6-phosphofructokinase [Proteobacteria bacterium]|nr:6-phosphofructokinase [Pseudomonadota bacterium]
MVNTRPKRIGVLTSGGDCPGMNAALRACVRTAIYNGIEVFGFSKGYRGVLENIYYPLYARSVSGIMQKGGTILQTARCPEFLEIKNQEKAAKNLRNLEIDGMVIIGGEGSLKGAIALERQGIPCVGIPASIDNDIPYTDMAIGVDTALNTILWATDAIKDTATSHERAFIIEVMGRNCGYLAVVAGIIAGAEYTLIPEAPLKLEKVEASLKKRFEEGGTNAIIIVAEGAGSAHEIAEKLKDKIGYEIRVSVLGHIQRGGSPTAFDRLLASRLGRSAVEHLIENKHNIMVGLQKSQIIATPLEEVATGKRKIDRDFLGLALMLGI